MQEMESVWSQYERMESELSVIRSHLQHICTFGMPQVFEKHKLECVMFLLFSVTTILQIIQAHVGSYFGGKIFGFCLFF